MIVLIDDLRSFRPNTVPQGETLLIARTLSEGLKTIKDAHSAQLRIDQLWLDHDLGENPTTGATETIMPIVDLIIGYSYEETPLNVNMIYIHTSNPVGRRNMNASLSNWGYKVVSLDSADYLIYE